MPIYVVRCCVDVVPFLIFGGFSEVQMLSAGTYAVVKLDWVSIPIKILAILGAAVESPSTSHLLPCDWVTKKIHIVLDEQKPWIGIFLSYQPHLWSTSPCYCSRTTFRVREAKEFYDKGCLNSNRTIHLGQPPENTYSARSKGIGHGYHIIFPFSGSKDTPHTVCKLHFWDQKVSLADFASSNLKIFAPESALLLLLPAHLRTHHFVLLATKRSWWIFSCSQA